MALKLVPIAIQKLQGLNISKDLSAALSQSLLFVGPDFGLKTFKWFYGPQISANRHTKLSGLSISKDLSLGLPSPCCL
jgi:hypothetical protein